jgi:DNA-binding CsgD family transcriptional regulator
VNYHLRNIFQKTATSRQAELITLLRSIQLSDPGPEP